MAAEQTVARQNTRDSEDSLTADGPETLVDLHQTAFAPTLTALGTGSASVSVVLGIGANATIFTLLDQSVLRPPQMDRPDELVQLRIDGEFPHPR
jgi:hypothetical protein